MSARLPHIVCTWRRQVEKRCLAPHGPRDILWWYRSKTLRRVVLKRIIHMVLAAQDWQDVQHPSRPLVVRSYSRLCRVAKVKVAAGRWSMQPIWSPICIPKRVLVKCIHSRAASGGQRPATGTIVVEAPAAAVKERRHQLGKRRGVTVSLAITRSRFERESPASFFTMSRCLVCGRNEISTF